jgi:hypothetical protein
LAEAVEEPLYWSPLISYAILFALLFDEPNEDLSVQEKVKERKDLIRYKHTQH